MRSVWSLTLLLMACVPAPPAREVPAGPESASFMLSVAVALLLTSGWSCDDEDRRITTHLRGALAQLESSPPADLTEAQRAARHDALAVLRGYIDAGRFPRRSGGGFVPVIVDEAGTRCAMGEVLFHTGGADLVDRVHETANEATIDQLSGDGELKARLEAIGFTLHDRRSVAGRRGGATTPRRGLPLHARSLCRRARAALARRPRVARQHRGGPPGRGPVDQRDALP